MILIATDTGILLGALAIVLISFFYNFFGSEEIENDYTEEDIVSINEYRQHQIQDDVNYIGELFFSGLSEDDIVYKLSTIIIDTNEDDITLMRYDVPMSRHDFSGVIRFESIYNWAKRKKTSIATVSITTDGETFVKRFKKTSKFLGEVSCPYDTFREVVDKAVYFTGAMLDEMEKNTDRGN